MSDNHLKLPPAQATLLRSLWTGNLAVFVMVTLLAFAFAPVHSAVSVAVGGAVAVGNFKILERTLRRAFVPGRGSGVIAEVLLKYYLRFAATAVLLWFLVRQGLVEPLGLLVGLSVVVASVFIVGAISARKLYKEAY